MWIVWSWWCLLKWKTSTCNLSFNCYVRSILKFWWLFPALYLPGTYLALAPTSHLKKFRFLIVIFCLAPIFSPFGLLISIGECRRLKNTTHRRTCRCTYALSNNKLTITEPYQLTGHVPANICGTSSNSNWWFLPNCFSSRVPRPNHLTTITLVEC